MTTFKRQIAVALTLFLAGCGAAGGGRTSLPVPPASDSGVPDSADVSGEYADQSTPSTDLSPSFQKFPKFHLPTTIVVGVTAIFGNSVSVYKTPFIGAPASIIGCGASASTITGCGPSALALDAGGNLFTLWNGAQLEEHLPPYNGNAALVTPLTGLHSYASMALNAIGEVFVVDSVGNEVGEYVSPTNSAPTAIVTSNINGPSRLGFDGARNLFVMNGGNGTFTEYASPYTAAPVKTIANPLNRVRGAGISGFAVDAAGDIFVANSSGNTVTEIAPPYVGPGRTIAVGLQTPIGLALDANGYLFVVNSGNSTVTEYAPPLYWVHQTVFTFQQCFCSYGGIMPSNYLNGLIAVH